MKKIAAFFVFLILPLFAFGSGQRKLQEWSVGSVVSPKEIKSFGEQRCFTSIPISDEIFKRMQGVSFRKNPYITREDLRYVKVLHYDRDGNIYIGELVCNKKIAQDLVDIFYKLYQARYPIHKMVLIDNYDAIDEKSMRDNNTSCFCYRQVAGSSKLSAHSRGMAVDVNTLYNPYYKRLKSGKEKIQPSNAREYVNRQNKFPYKIDKNDLCYKLFIQYGFKWGGAWRSLKDYQHFEK